jgi:hypothetical protein
MYTYNAINFKNYGFLDAKFSDSDLAPIKNEINNIQNNFELHESQKFNNILAGNIKREYHLIESHEYSQNLFLPLVYDYNNYYDYLRNFTMLSKSVPIVLDKCWVNFQKKYEFNPPHTHTGILSYVLWTYVPYDMEEERMLSPGAESNTNRAGMFSLLYTNTLGKVTTHDISVDKNMENNILIFPSNFSHMVYPFFTSDGYRISVSGNFKLKID